MPFLGAAAAAPLTLLYFDLFVAYLQEPGEIVFHWGVFTIVWAFGYWPAQLRAAGPGSRPSAAIAAEVAAAEQAMAAVVEERTRIARELHDIVAHR